MPDQPVAQGDPKPGDVLIAKLREPRAGTHYIRDDNDRETGETVDEFKRFEVMQAEREEAAHYITSLLARAEAAEAQRERIRNERDLFIEARALDIEERDKQRARAEAAEAKLNAIGLLLDVDAEHTGWDRIRELKAQLAQAERALESLRQMGEDISDMAEDFITARDVTSLRNYGSNVQNIARRTLEQGDKDAS